MKQTLGWLMGGVLFVASANAQLRVSDPHQILNTLDGVIGSIPFDQAIHCGDQTEAELNDCQYTCSGASCSEYCVSDTITERVKECGAERAVIESVTAAGLQTRELTRALYESRHGNRFRDLLESGEYGAFPLISGVLGPKDSVVLEGIRSTEKVLPSGQRLQGLEIDFVFWIYEDGANDPILLPMVIIMGLDLPYLGQVLGFRYYDPSLKPIYLLKGYGQLSPIPLP